MIKIIFQIFSFIGNYLIGWVFICFFVTYTCYQILAPVSYGNNNVKVTVNQPRLLL